ncbi:MAG: class I adenylate-forming enzyme family protein [Candidatus Nanopelagicales bacterium]
MASHGLPTDDALVIGDLINAYADWTPDAPAVTAMSAYGGQHTMSYVEYDQLTNRVAKSLVDLGVRRGERVAFMTSNAAGREGAVTYLGAHKAAAVALPINGRLTPHEVVPLAEHAEISVLVVEPAYLEHAEAVRNSLANPPLIIAAVVDPPAGMIGFRTLHERPDVGRSALPRVGPTDMADWLFTSGTTAAPKCVMLTHHNCVAAAHILMRWCGTRESDVLLTPFPFFTSSGVHTSFLTAVTGGGHYIISNHVQAELLMREIERFRATIVGAVPSIFGYMAKSESVGQVDLTSVRLAFHGGAPVSPHQVASYQRLFPRAEVMNVFGQTESGNPGTILPGHFARQKAGSIGKAGMPGVRIRVVDDEGNDIVPPGVGELLLQSEAVMVGYYRNEEETAKTLRDGWLYTGDLVRVEQDGFLYVHDRKKDIIVRGGYNIASIEIENALSSHEHISGAAVIGKAHADLGEDLVAFVVAEGDERPSVEELREHCRSLLADYKIPRDIRYIDDLPRNPTGKILKRELRAHV